MELRVLELTSPVTMRPHPSMVCIQSVLNTYGGNGHSSSLTIFSGSLPWLPDQVGVVYSWGPSALPGAGTDCLPVLQLPRSVLCLSCLHSRWEDSGGQSLLFLCMLHGV